LEDIAPCSGQLTPLPMINFKAISADNVQFLAKALR